MIFICNEPRNNTDMNGWQIVSVNNCPRNAVEISKPILVVGLSSICGQ